MFEIHKASRMRFSLIVAMFGLSLAACGGSRPSDESSPGRSFSLGLIPGAQGFVDFVMVRQSILDDFGLRPEKLQSLNPPTLHLMLAEGQVDIGYAGFTTMATARSQGKDTIVVYGVFSPVNAVFVPHDSKLDSLDDLRGLKLGIFGGPGSTTFGFLSVIAKNWYDLDLFNDVELITAPGPVLIELMERGDLDAVLLGTIESIEMQAEERFRVLTDLSAEYREHEGGRAPAHVTIATNEAFANANPDIVRDYLAAYRTTLDYIRNNPEVWDAFADSIEMESPASRRMLREKMGPNLIDTWDAEQIAVQNDYLNLVKEVIGESVLGSVPNDLIRDEYSP
jgi:ABC-type nitrate/sulfonate/bicarbonate transport system substrate-binding protein